MEEGPPSREFGKVGPMTEAPARSDDLPESGLDREPQRPSRWMLVAAAALVFALGIRLDYAIRFPPDYTWDTTHHRYAAFVAERHRIPKEDEDPSLWGNMFWHTPLFYVTCAVLGGPKLSFHTMKRVNVVAGLVRLAVFAAALYVFLRRRPRVLAFSMILFAILPLASQVDAGISNEPMSATFAAMALVFLLWTVEHRFRGAWWLWVALFGAFVALAALSKLSGIVVLSAGVGLWLVRPTRERFAVAVLSIVVCLLMCAPYFAMNYARYGRPLTQSHISRDARFNAWKAQHSLLEYRPLRWFVVPPTFDLLRKPHYPRAESFWAIMYVWAWGDYEGHLTRRGDRGHGWIQINDKRVDRRAFEATRPILYSAAPATALVFVSVVAAFLFIVRRVRWRRSEELSDPAVDKLVVLVFPTLCYVLFLMAYGFWYPFDQNGVIKSVYVLGAVPSICVLGGLGYDRAWRVPVLRPALILSLLIPAGAVVLHRVVW